MIKINFQQAKAELVHDQASDSEDYDVDINEWEEGKAQLIQNCDIKGDKS